jgi:hypothetical protein
MMIVQLKRQTAAQETHASSTTSDKTSSEESE